jgi:hypothetical protein
MTCAQAAPLTPTVNEVVMRAVSKPPTSYPLKRLTRTSPRIGQTAWQTVSPGSQREYEIVLVKSLGSAVMD